MALKFHLDEHVSRAIAEGVRRRGIDVVTTVDVGLVSADDLQHIYFARRGHRVIYTHDEDFLVTDGKEIPLKTGGSSDLTSVLLRGFQHHSTRL